MSEAEMLSKELRDIPIDDMAPATWRTMPAEQRAAWHAFWGAQGKGCFTCHDCDFPITSGGAPCEVCDEEWFVQMRAEQARAKGQGEG